MVPRNRLHQLVEQLPEDDVGAVERLLEQIAATKNPVLRSLLLAPVDDELETEDERLAVAEAEEDIVAGRLVAHEDLKRELGV